MTQMSATRNGFTIVRELDAPRELVFQAWTDPDHLEWWFAATEAAANVERQNTSVDLQVGGRWWIDMAESEDRVNPTGGIYLEITPPEKLVFIWGATDGWPQIDPEHPDHGPTVTLTFEDLGGKTNMTLQVAFADHLSEEAIEEWLATGMEDGWSQTVDRLNPYLSQLAR